MRNPCLCLQSIVTRDASYRPTLTSENDLCAKKLIIEASSRQWAAGLSLDISCLCRQMAQSAVEQYSEHWMRISGLSTSIALNDKT